MILRSIVFLAGLIVSVQEAVGKGPGESETPGFVVGEYSQRFTDFAMDQRLCIATSVGFEYLANVLSTIQDRYVKFYNNPRRYHDKAMKHRRGKQVEKGQKSIKSLDLDVNLVNQQKVQRGTVKADVSGQKMASQLVLDLPVAFEIEDKRGKVTG